MLNVRRRVATSGRTAGVLLAALLSSSLLGCRQRLNEHDSLYGVGPLPALTAEAESFLAPSGKPSVTRGHDRRHWPSLTVTAPGRQVEHHPSYVCLVQCTNDTARQFGEAPTVHTALALEPRSAAHVGEFFVDAVQAAMLPILIPARMVMDASPPWAVRCGPAPTQHRGTTEPRGGADPWRWIAAPNDGSARP